MNKFYATIIAGLLLTGCAPKMIINYSDVSVPEEGGTRFTQFTRDDENVRGPAIEKTATDIYWYAPPLIAVAPAGDLVAYIAWQNNTNNIFIKNTAGGRATVQRTFRTGVLDVTFSPDGRHLAFTDMSDGNANVYVINAKEGSAIQQITSTTADESGPAFSPDGKDIFFTKTERTTFNDGTSSTRYYVWNINRQSSLLTQFTEGFTPSPSPADSKMVVITRNNKQSKKGEIWTINTETGQETIILSDVKKGFSSPKLSPDGKKIVCVGTTEASKNKPASLDLFTININGTGLTQHTFHPGNDVSPEWAPDGKSIYFLAQRGNPKGLWNVWKMDIKSE